MHCGSHTSADAHPAAESGAPSVALPARPEFVWKVAELVLILLRTLAAPAPLQA